MLRIIIFFVVGLAFCAELYAQDNPNIVSMIYFKPKAGQKKQYLAELGLEPVLDYYNKEILKHRGLCKLSLELRKKRDRCFKLMREEYQELC